MRIQFKPFRLDSLLTSVIIAVIVSSCDPKESGLDIASQATVDKTARVGSDKLVTHYGPAVPLGGGVARTFVSATKSGELTEIGVAISQKVLIALMKDGGESYQKVLQFPNQVNIAPFQHVFMDWNAHGHEPDPIYGLPHFDFHFYTISSKAREAIPGLSPELYDQAPLAKYMPADYVQTPGRVPAMGAHWIDPYSPEFHPPSIFTSTFIYGSYNANVIFYEPMITLDYLLNGGGATFPIKQPAAFAQTGQYPTQYSIRYDSQSKDYLVSLMSFVPRTGG